MLPSKALHQGLGPVNLIGFWSNSRRTKEYGEVLGCAVMGCLACIMTPTNTTCPFTHTQRHAKDGDHDPSESTISYTRHDELQLASLCTISISRRGKAIFSWKLHWSRLLILHHTTRLSVIEVLQEFTMDSFTS